MTDRPVVWAPAGSVVISRCTMPDAPMALKTMTSTFEQEPDVVGQTYVLPDGTIEVVAVIGGVRSTHRVFLREVVDTIVKNEKARNASP